LSLFDLALFEKGWSVLFTRATDLVQIRACQQSSVF
jgi:hypothetical protein